MPLRRYLLNNWGLKLVSLGFATVIWLVVNAILQKEIQVPRNSVRTDPTREFSKRPISVLTAAGERSLFRVVPDEVTVKVSCCIALLQQISPADIQPFIKVSNGLEPHGPVAVQVYLPPGVKLEDVSPKAANIEL